MSMDLPIFPLQTVLFPRGTLALKIFEPRYMAMAAECMKSGTSFGICLIAEGNEVGTPARPHDVGSAARIVQWDMPQLGILQVIVHGGQRFRILDRAVDSGGLVRARIEWLQDDAPRPFPESCARMLPLLRQVIEDLGEERVPAPHAFESADWVAYRYAEILPIPLLARQKLLELDDSLFRLEIIFRFLDEHQLLA
jgi:hypothetical protein